jgi:hypothetical protein
MRPRLRTTMNLAAGAVTLGALLLGGAWVADRAHRWESPEWRHRSFVRLRGTSASASAGVSTWVVAVNPRCPHCVAALAQLRATWDRNRWRDDLAALIVDTPRRPGAQALQRIPIAQVWWDRDGVWRRRWGHRLYGELLQFDGSGHFVGTGLAPDILRRSHLPQACVPLAPVTRKEGGS